MKRTPKYIDWDEIREKVRAGHSQNAIAKHLRTSRQALDARCLKENGCHVFALAKDAGKKSVRSLLSGDGAINWDEIIAALHLSAVDEIILKGTMLDAQELNQRCLDVHKKPWRVWSDFHRIVRSLEILDGQQRATKTGSVRMLELGGRENAGQGDVTTRDEQITMITFVGPVTSEEALDKIAGYNKRTFGGG